MGVCTGRATGRDCCSQHACGAAEGQKQKLAFVDSGGSFIASAFVFVDHRDSP